MERPSLRQLECVAAVAEHLNFRRAAEAVAISQPALSLQIQQLETMLGLRLFERDRRRVLPTPAGSELVRHAHVALTAIDAFVDVAGSLRDPLAGTLRMGVIPTVAPYVLPLAMGPVRRAFPKLRLLLREDQTARLVERVQSGQLDLALLALEADLGSLSTRALYADPFLLAVPGAHPLALKKSAREDDLADRDVLLLEEGHCLREQALSICKRAGAHELGDFRATSLNTLVRMVASGSGVTLLPAMSLPVEVHGADRVVTLALERRPSRTIGLAWRPSSPRTKLFELLARVLCEHAPKGTKPIARGGG
jgi:LysR family hydrogen peroxide-inducible transcriptional activator